MYPADSPPRSAGQLNTTTLADGASRLRKGELVEILWTLHPCLQAFAMGFSVIFHSMPSSHFARAFLSSRSYSCHSARSRGSQHQARLLWVPVLSTWGCHMPCWKHSVPWSQCCKCEFVRSAESAGRAYSALCGASWRELHGLDKRIPHRVAARSSGWTSRVRSARNRDVHQVRISPSGRACGFAPLDEARLSFL